MDILFYVECDGSVIKNLKFFKDFSFRLNKLLMVGCVWMKNEFKIWENKI